MGCIYIVHFLLATQAPLSHSHTLRHNFLVHTVIQALQLLTNTLMDALEVIWGLVSSTFSQQILPKQILIKQRDMTAGCKYLLSCHGIHPLLKIQFKQCLSNHQESDIVFITAPMRTIVTTPHKRLTGQNG